MTKRNLFLGLAAVAALSACDADRLTDANRNPNDPTDAPSSALFTNSARLAAARWVDGVGGTRYGFLPQHLAQVQYPDDDQYLAARLGAVATTPLFDGSYSAELQDLDVVIDRGMAANDAGTWGPAQVLSQWEFGILTDVFGDIPYSEAFDPAVLKPAYDAQADVYTGIFTNLNAAADALGGASNSLGNGDPIYGGDPAGWRRFANSVRLRHAMRLINVPAEAARVTAEVAAATAPAEGGLILTNAQNADLPWPGNGIYDNPWANNFKTRDDHRVSTRLMRYMRDLNDPRVGILAQPVPTAAVLAERQDTTLNYCVGATCYVGLANALTHTVASPLVPNTSRPGLRYFPAVTSYGAFPGGTGVSYPTTLMSAAEVEFLLAEAAERGIAIGTGGTAATHYANGVRLHMEMLGVPDAEITAYLAQATVSYATAATQQERLIRIAVQKWIALFEDPIQAWSEVRRTCQPAIVEPGPNARFATIPRRLQYSNTERSVNRGEYDIALERQWAKPAGSNDVMTDPIYWDTVLQATTAVPTYQAGCSQR